MKKLFTIIFFTIIGLNNTKAATFSSVSSGTWSTPATWTLTSGTDTDGIPDKDDDVTINGGHSISLAVSGNFVKNLTNNGSLIGNSKVLNFYGNFTNTGTGSKIVFFIQAPCILTSSNAFGGYYSFFVNSTLTISAGTSISTPNSISLYAGKSVINNGSVYIVGGIIMNGTWTNQPNSIVTVNANITGSGVLNATSIGNSVIYRNPACNKIKATTYYNLTIAAAGSTTRTAEGNMTVLNNFTLGSGSANNFSLANFTLTIGGNWTNGGNTTVINQGPVIFNGTGVQVVTRASTEVINNLILNGSGTVSLATSLDVSQSLTINSGIFDLSASNFTVNIAGNLTNNATINPRSGLFNFNGAAGQTISGSASTNFYNVKSSNAAGVSVTGTSVISNILTVNSGTFGTSGAGTIKIPATGPTTYGRIDNVAGSLIGTGWTIESYINGPAQQGFQWLSSPINGNILADWDNDARFWMSGISGNDGNAGTYKSVRTYNEPTDTRSYITNKNITLITGKGYEVWMADSKTSAQLSSPLIYNSVGIPNFGNKSIAITAGGVGSGYNLVGNPYACPITYSAVVAATGIIDPSFVILLESGLYSTDPNSGIIAPNQGFMCVAYSGGSINFTEACKNTSSLPNILRTAPKNNSVIFNVYNDINGLGGQTTIEFSENAADVFEQNKDLSFLASPYDEADNIWTNTFDNKPMLRNALYANDNEKNVPLTVKTGVYGMHTISVKGLASLTNYNSVMIEDLTTGKKIDLLKEQNYSFNAAEIGKEYNFVVHFSKNNLSDSPKSIITSNTLNENTSVYNTPSNVVIKFDMPEETPVTISVYNLTGQQVITTMNLNVVSDRIALPLQKENGMYLLIIQSKDQKISRKIIF